MERHGSGTEGPRANGYRPLAEWLAIASACRGRAGGDTRGIARTMEGWCELIRLKGVSMSHAERLNCERALGALHRRLSSARPECGVG